MKPFVTMMSPLEGYKKKIELKPSERIHADMHTYINGRAYRAIKIIAVCVYDRPAWGSRGEGNV